MAVMRSLARSFPLPGREGAALEIELLLHLSGDSGEGWSLSTEFGPPEALPDRPEGRAILSRVELAFTAHRGLGLVELAHRGSIRSPGAVVRPASFSWLPTLKRGRRDVAGEHVFRSPCVAAMADGVLVAMLPRIDGQAGVPEVCPRPAHGAPVLRRYLDLEVPDATHCSRLVYGLCDHRTHGHVFHGRTGRPVPLRAGESLRLEYLLLVDAQAGDDAWREIPRLLWAFGGRRALVEGARPDALRLVDRASQALGCVLGRYVLWRDLPLAPDAAPAGGLCVRVVRPSLDLGSEALPQDITPGVALNYLLTPTLRLRDKLALARANARGLGEHVWNNIFFNEARTAFGLACLARERGDGILAGKARAMRELALCAPSVGGIFPSVLAGPGRPACPSGPALRPTWVPGTRVWRYTSAYSTLDASWTAMWLLESWRHVEADPRLLGRAEGLGGFLLKVQDRTGAFPCWVKVGADGTPLPAGALRRCAASALPAAFLADLAEATGERRYLAAAERTAEFLDREVFPGGEWLDPEVYFSCSPKRPGWRDRHSGAPLVGTLALSWTADLLRRLGSMTGEARWIKRGREALDLLLLFQQVWSPPFIGFDAAGGFGAINTDAEWSDARQAQFGTLLMDWHGLSGEAELFERGAAALRASFALMHHPSRADSAPGNNAGIGEADRGAIPENYGHAGHDAKIPGYIMPDWGAGSAVSSAYLARLRWGDLHVDRGRGQAFALDGCRIRSAVVAPGHVELSLEREPPAGGGILLKERPLAGEGARLVVDGRDLGWRGADELGAGVMI